MMRASPTTLDTVRAILDDVRDHGSVLIEVDDHLPRGRCCRESPGHWLVRPEAEAVLLSMPGVVGVGASR